MSAQAANEYHARDFDRYLDGELRSELAHEQNLSRR